MPVSISEQVQHVLEFFELSPFLLLVCDEKGKVFLSNDAWVRELGWSSEDLVQSRQWDFVHEDERDKIQEILTRVKNEGSISEYTLRMKTYDGKYKYIEWSAFSKNGLIYAFGRNASTQKNREKSFEMLIDNLPLALFAKDSQNDYRFILWNKMAENFFGLSRAEVIGKNDFDFFPSVEASHFRKKDEEVITKNTTIKVDQEPVTSSGGKTKWVRTYKNAISITGDKSSILLGVSEDITELLAEKEKNEQAKQKLLVSARLASLGEMSLGVAHEINNPLAVLKGKVSSIRRKIESGTLSPLALQSDLEKLESAVGRIAKVVRSLGHFSSLTDDGRQYFHSLHEIVTDASSLSKEKFHINGVRYNIEIVPQLQVYCRRSNLVQAIGSVLSNSYEAALESVDPWIKVVGVEDPQVIKLEISDSGKGVPAENVDKIFEPFFTTKACGKGMGLGLSAAFGLVKEDGGRIYLNTQSTYTQFVIEIPKKAKDI